MTTQWLDWERVMRAWSEGGWVMIPLALIGACCYVAAIRVLRYLWQRGRGGLEDRDLARWIRRPGSCPGELGDILKYVVEDKPTVQQIRARFGEVRGAKIPEVDRRLAFVNVLVAAAPLLGLLGTVLGMLKTFQGIAMGGGRMVDTIARGISEALITTEMGLLIALPGMVLAYWVRRKRNDYVAFLARLESLAIQQSRYGGPLGGDGSLEGEVEDERGTRPERTRFGADLNPAGA